MARFSGVLRMNPCPRRTLQNPIYTGDFLWLGKRRKGSHTALVSHETFDRVQEVLGGKSRPRTKRRHAFMGLLTCGRCGCAMTEERLAQLLADVIKPIQISEEVASDIANAFRESTQTVEDERAQSTHQLEQRRRTVASKMDRAYDDFLEGRISDEFWKQKSSTWEGDRLEQRVGSPIARAEKILELAKNAEFLYKSQDPTERRRLLETVLSNCTFDRGSLTPTYSSPFDLLVKGNETGDWRGRRDSNPRPLP